MAKPIENVDYFVRMVDFPVLTCGGAVMPNDDGTYTILINDRLSEKKKKAALDHEVRHIERGDLYKMSVEEAEY